MATEKQIEANRQNAQKSTGPKTEAGKSRSRQNATRHGLTAMLLLPNECPAAFAAHVQNWTGAYAGTDPFQRDILERAANASWQRNRVALAESAHLAEAVRFATLNYDLDERERALALGRLLTYRPGDLATLPQVYDRIWGPHFVDRLKNDPSLIALELKKSLAGVNLLLEQWDEWIDRLGATCRVHADDRVKAVRMLGRRPEDLMDDLTVQEFLLGCHAFYGSCSLSKAAHEFVHCAHDFELDNEQIVTILEPNLPATQEGGMKLILQIVNQEITALRSLREALLPLDAASRAEAPLRAQFDPKLSLLFRRYASSIERDLSRAHADFLRSQKHTPALLQPQPQPEPEPEPELLDPEPETEENPAPTPHQNPSRNEPKPSARYRPISARRARQTPPSPPEPTPAPPA